jgi:outer membrane lipopolysaccharide assembly protein LptE/RlpB
MISRAFALLLAVVLLTPPLLLSTGCGYHLGEVRPTTMRSVRDVAVPTFKNRTYQPRVEVLLANALIRQLQVDGTYTVVGTERADAIIYGTLQNARRIPIRSAVSNVLRTTEYRLTLDINFEVQDRITGAILMSGSVSGSTTFFPTGDLVTDERQAFSVAAQRAMENLARRISTGW